MKTIARINPANEDEDERDFQQKLLQLHLTKKVLFGFYSFMTREKKKNQKKIEKMDITVL